MSDLWPWLAIAGAGAAHGMSPANGWVLAAACGVHARDAAQARHALRPIAFGQVASMAVLAWTFSRGLSFDRALMRDLAAALLVAAALYAVSSSSPRIALAWRGAAKRIRSYAPARDAGIALWSFLMASAQGAGLVLMPALIPLCAGDASSPELPLPGSVALALATVGVHTAAMLLTTGLVATGVCRGVELVSTWCRFAKRVARPKPARAPATRASCSGNVAQSQRIQSSERIAELP